MKTKQITDIKREYVNPSISVMKLEYNGMLCVSDYIEEDTDTHFDATQPDETPIKTDKTWPTDGKVL